MNKIKVLIVDDSSFMRNTLKTIIDKNSDLELVGVAHNGLEAVDLARELNPDIITMDIEMPKMTGLEALKIIMSENPVPVIMVSSLTSEGADATLQALDLGALDFITKTASTRMSMDLNSSRIEEDLLKKIRRFAKNKSAIRNLRNSLLKNDNTNLVLKAKTKTITKIRNRKIVALGTSTGGPQSLQRVIPKLPADIGVPIVITQHMPPGFTHSLANRLNTMSAVSVVEASEKTKLEPNVVYIAKGGMHLKFIKISGNIYMDLSAEPSNYFNIPAVDVMVSSLIDIYGQDILGVIMTGMGTDGLKGFEKLNKCKGLVIAQDEASSIIYGMPRAVVDAGIADEIVPLDDIASRITYHCKN